MAKVNHSQPLVPAIDVAERPIDTMLDRLRQAHATLDLISVLTSNAKTGHTVLGYLYEGTLHTATHRAMLRVSGSAHFCFQK